MFHPRALVRVKLALLLCLSSFVMALPAQSRAEWSIEQLEIQLDFTIRSACHGYMIDAIPDFFSEGRDWLNKNTPFCQTVRTMGKTESAYQYFKEELVSRQIVSTPVQELQESTESSGRIRAYYEQQQRVDIECQDWMCQHIRTRVWEQGHPIALSDYQRVSEYCGESYGCIETWFETWPRPLPENRVQLSLDALLQGQQPSQQAGAALNEAGDASPGFGLSLSSLMNGDTGNANIAAAPTSDVSNPRTAGSELTLENVLSGRAQIAMDEAQGRLQQANKRMASACNCTLENTGCYTVPSQDLMASAEQAEVDRYEICSTWKEQSEQDFANPDAIDAFIAATGTGRQQLSGIDKSVDRDISNWRAEQKRLAARARKQQKEREDQAFFAGLGAVIAQGGIAASGQITAEQAARNAANIAKRIENSGPRFTPQKEQKLKSSNPNMAMSMADAGSTGNPPAGQGRFSCYSASMQICIDYTISASKLAQFRGQCQASGSKIVSSCDQSGPSCTISNASGSQTTFSYFSEHGSFRAQCRSNGGRYKLY